MLDTAGEPHLMDFGLARREAGENGGPPGDLYVVLEIALPPADDDASREAYEAFAKAAPFNPRGALGV